MTYTGAQLLVDYVFCALAQVLKPCDPRPGKILIFIQSCSCLCQQEREKRVKKQKPDLDFCDSHTDRIRI